MTDDELMVNAAELNEEIDRVEERSAELHRDSEKLENRKKMAESMK